jgi:hypothetical protein
MTWTIGKKRCQKVASINSLGSLTQLKRLYLDNYEVAIIEGTVESMVDMEKFELTLSQMTSLPHGMFGMSKLRKVQLQCLDIVRMESKFCEFQNLTVLQLWNCVMLEELPDLHRIKSLRKLDIFNCIKLKRFPKEFGEIGALSLLEKFSMVQLDELEELPIIEEGAMPSLKIVTIMLCETLKMFPESYLNIKQLQKVRVYGCSIILENLGSMEKTNKEIEVITMSTIKTKEFRDQYLQVRNTLLGSLYSEFTCSELFLFLRDLYRPL